MSLKCTPLVLQNETLLCGGVKKFLQYNVPFQCFGVLGSKLHTVLLSATLVTVVTLTTPTRQQVFQSKVLRPS